MDIYEEEVQEHHDGAQDLKIPSNSKLLHRTYPFNDEDWKGKNHWRILAVVQSIHVGAKVVGPCCPGTKNHHGTPDDHGKVDDAHDQNGQRVDLYNNLLSGVNPLVALRAHHVDRSPGAECCEGEVVRSGFI